MPFIHKGVQLSPCIVSKARIALGISNRTKINNKKCTAYYWRHTLMAVGGRYNISSSIIDSAVNEYKVYCS